jgi:hypothetical protein
MRSYLTLSDMIILSTMTHAPSLNRQDFNLVNIEAGVKVWNDVGASGELTASFSLSAI